MAKDMRLVKSWGEIGVNKTPFTLDILFFVFNSSSISESVPMFLNVCEHASTCFGILPPEYFYQVYLNLKNLHMHTHFWGKWSIVNMI